MTSSRKPDTEIKLFNDTSDQKEKDLQLRELKQFQGLTLQLSENIHGNIFNRPFPYITFRHVGGNEELPEDLKDDGDPMKDYFFTLRGIRREKVGPSLGYVFMGFKVLDNDQNDLLDKTWKEWTGIQQLLRQLDPVYIIKRVHSWKSCNIKADLFKYCLLIEIALNDENGEEVDDVIARDIIQKFRIKRMSGYVALYTKFSQDDIAEALVKNEAEGAVVYNLIAN